MGSKAQAQRSVDLPVHTCGPTLPLQQALTADADADGGENVTETEIADADVSTDVACAGCTLRTLEVQWV